MGQQPPEQAFREPVFCQAVRWPGVNRPTIPTSVCKLELTLSVRVNPTPDSRPSNTLVRFPLEREELVAPRSLYRGTGVDDV